MTVQVRPTPARTWGNSIKPFRAVKPGPQLPTYTLKTWKPPVPEPLPPAPLLGLPSLLALGALVLAQLWGLFAGRPATTEPATALQGGTITGVVPPPGNTSWGDFYFTVSEGTATVYRNMATGGELQCETGSTLPVSATGPTGHVNFATAVEFSPEPGPCGPTRWGFKVTKLTGEVVYKGALTSTWGVKDLTFGVQLFWDGPGAVPYEATDTDLPVPDGYSPGRVPIGTITGDPFAPVTAEELAALRPVPLPLPDGEPLTDPANPQPQTTPLTVPAPLVAPTVPLLQPLPAGVQLLPDGTLPTPQAAAVPQTPQGTHYPATGLAIPANSPAPTLKGIAQEVGRVESKLNKLLNPASDNNFDRLELIYDTISGLFDFLTSITAGGSYTLEAPCETAEDGSPLVVEHTYDGALNSIGVLSNKIDALAAMLQTVKNQKQPVCKAPPRQGQAVTVNFEEV